MREPRHVMEITLKLELNEVNVLLDLMGAQPTSTNIWPLAAKVRNQAEQQLKEPPTQD